jgi:hypothetical protein
LKEQTVKEKFPIPVVEELLDEHCGTSFFSKIDLRSGYHQVLMHVDDIAKMAFQMHQGLFEFLVMPFSLTNTSATFQALMNDVLQPFLCRFILVFVDDILIYSYSWSEHLWHLWLILTMLKEHQLFMKRAKCAFSCTKIFYLSHVISSAGVTMNQNKVQAVLDWPVPAMVHAVPTFLGLAGYYHCFIHDYSAIS